MHGHMKVKPRFNIIHFLLNYIIYIKFNACSLHSVFICYLLKHHVSASVLGHLQGAQKYLSHKWTDKVHTLKKTSELPEYGQ